VKDGVILLVEDDPNDEALTLRALSKSAIHHEVVVARVSSNEDGTGVTDTVSERTATSASPWNSESSRVLFRNWAYIGFC
jgi:hypothetical protein